MSDKNGRDARKTPTNVFDGYYTVDQGVIEVGCFLLQEGGRAAATGPEVDLRGGRKTL